MAEFCQCQVSRWWSKGDGDLVCTGISGAGQAAAGSTKDDSSTGSVFLGCLPLSLGTTDLVPMPEGSVGLSAIPVTDSHGEAWVPECGLGAGGAEDTKQYGDRFRLFLKTYALSLDL